MVFFLFILSLIHYTPDTAANDEANGSDSVRVKKTSKKKKIQAQKHWRSYKKCKIKNAFNIDF